MVNPPLISADVVADPEVRLVIAYAPAVARSVLTALWAFDARLAAILRTTSEPMIGQMRLTWWYDALDRPGAHKEEPVLAALAGAEISAGSTRCIIEGWEALLDGDDEITLDRYAVGRGSGLFAAATTALEAPDDIAQAGAAWALVDLARHHSRPEVVRRALAMAADRHAEVPCQWSKLAQPLAMLAKLTLRDLAKPEPEPQGSPRRIAALAALALFGR